MMKINFQHTKSLWIDIAREEGMQAIIVVRNPHNDDYMPINVQYKADLKKEREEIQHDGFEIIEEIFL